MSNADSNQPTPPLAAEMQALFDAMYFGEYTESMRLRLNELLETSDLASNEFVKNVHYRAVLRMLLGPAIEVGTAAQVNSPEPNVAIDEQDSLAADMPRVLLGMSSESPREEVKRSPWPITWDSWGELPFSGQIGLGVLLCVLLLVAGVWLGSTTLSGDVEPQSGSELAIPIVKVGPVQVESGTVRMILPQVGDLVVEGPAKFALVSPMKLRLEEGRIKIRVTDERGHGFVVATPHGDIVDLGTEFGVDASDAASSKVLVFDGKVDLHLPAASHSVTRISRGEGVQFNRDGQLDRIVSVSTGGVATFLLPSGDSEARLHAGDELPTINSVYDNIRGKQTRTFYEIVRGGFQDDVLAYVDRRYRWRGADNEGIPRFLEGADYIRTFNNDKLASLQVTIELAKRADVYVFWDKRAEPAQWLKDEFFDTGRFLDLVEHGRQDVEERGDPPHVHACAIWKRRQPSDGKALLGPMNAKNQFVSMYGIAACAVADGSGADAPGPRASKDSGQSSQ